MFWIYFRDLTRNEVEGLVCYSNNYAKHYIAANSGLTDEQIQRISSSRLVSGLREYTRERPRRPSSSTTSSSLFESGFSSNMSLDGTPPSPQDRAGKLPLPILTKRVRDLIRDIRTDAELQLSELQLNRMKWFRTRHLHPVASLVSCMDIVHQALCDLIK